ncbi:MAG: M15 family metallopeptidase [Ilumatobacteraceae bacterium]
MNDIAAAGLAAEINTANTNSYGGCFYPRLNRVTGNLGFLSRHSWGAAIDMNTTQNPQGAAPELNCGVVRIMRKWGFAWGGNFVNPDGMHFEYVGERRDLPTGYPSAYCPNSAALTDSSATAALNAASTATSSADGLTAPDDRAGISRFFAEDGLSES